MRREDVPQREPQLTGVGQGPEQGVGPLLVDHQLRVHHLRSPVGQKAESHLHQCSCSLRCRLLNLWPSRHQR
ncbi:hypothetical protein Hanom_Chr12g01124521 [Helianthus anomalus]